MFCFLLLFILDDTDDELYAFSKVLTDTMINTLSDDNDDSYAGYAGNPSDLEPLDNSMDTSASGIPIRNIILNGIHLPIHYKTENVL